MEQLLQAILGALVLIIGAGGVYIATNLKSAAKDREFVRAQAEKLNVVQGKLEDITKQHTQTEKSLATTQTQLTLTKEQLNREAERSNNQQHDIGRLTQSNITNEAEITRLRDAKNAADQNITRLEQDLQTRSAANAETKAENEKLTTERTQLQDKVHTLEVEIGQLKKDIEELKTAQKHGDQRVSRLRFALQSVFRLMTEDQRLELDKLLATKDMTFAELVIPGPEGDAPDVDERIQQLRQMNDFHRFEVNALITAMNDKGISQVEVSKILKVAHERWRPPDDTPPGPAGVVGQDGELLKAS